MTRENYESWEENGEKSCAQKVKEKTQWILNHHEVEPLRESTFKDLNKLLNDIYEQAKLRRK
jgi:trimethylamine:corrinoid methyltransferase-like protein